MVPPTWRHYPQVYLEQSSIEAWQGVAEAKYEMPPSSDRRYLRHGTTGTTGTRARQALTASSWCPHRAHSASRTTTRWTRPPAVLTNSWQLVLSRTTSWKSLLLVPVLTSSPSTPFLLSSKRISLIWTRYCYDVTHQLLCRILGLEVHQHPTSYQGGQVD